MSRQQGLDESHFLILLRKLDFPRETLERDMASFSMGQRKKVLLAASLAMKAHLYLRDESLNYIDLPSREQIEAMLEKTRATILFVEHDRLFEAKIATRRLELG